MRHISVIAIVLACFPVQKLQNYAASLSLKRVKLSFYQSGVATCSHPVDHRAQQVVQPINIRASPLSGLGLFANASIPCGSIIYDAYHKRPIRIVENTSFEVKFWGITNVAARVNHYHVPSARVEFHPESDRYVLYALREIYEGEEVTVDYLDRPYFAPPSFPQWDVREVRSELDSVARDTCAASDGTVDCDIDSSIPVLERALRLIVISVKWMLPVALLAL